MKKLSYFLLVVLLCGTACTQNMKYRDASVQAPAGNLSPKDGYFLELRAGAEAATTFMWLPGSCEDGLPAQYDIVFYDDAGKELMRVDAGTKTQIVVSHKTMNLIANIAGIAAGETGTVYWTATAARGKVLVPSLGEPCRLDIKRLLGFDFIPEKLWLVGSGTEAGTDPADAIPFRVTADGEYEIYTQLSLGEYMFVDDPFNPQNSYGVSGALAIETDVPLETPGEAVYRIRLDFNVKSATLQKITMVRHWTCSQRIWTSSTYVGRGVWRVNMYLNPNYYSDYGNPGDDRYQFRALIEGLPGDANFTESWGPVNSGNDGRPSSLDALEYFYLVPYTFSQTDQWNPKFKFHASTFGKTVNIYIDMGAEIATHYFEIL